VRPHGGVALFIASHFPAYILDATVHSSGEWEAIWCSVQIPSYPGHHLQIGCYYRIPSSTIYPVHWPAFLTHLNSSPSTNKKHNIILLGDFNLPKINWQLQSSSESIQSASVDFIEFLQENQLSQHVIHPTRHRFGQVSSLLDLVITSNELSSTTVFHNPPIGKSDHDVLSFSIESSFTKKLSSQTKFNFKSADYILLNDIISSINWEEEFFGVDLNVMVKTLQSFLQNVIKTFIPISKSQSRTGPAWITPEVHLLINRKKRAYFALRKFPTPANLAIFKEARRAASSAIKQAKHAYEKNLISRSKTDPKLLYAYLNADKKTQPANCLKTANNVLTDDLSIAVELNSHFKTSFIDSALPSPPAFTSEVQFTKQDITDIITSLKSNTSSGPDGIPPIFLKMCAPSLTDPLFLIFQESFQTNIFPSSWKDANITPVLKSGSPHAVVNYRPISLLSVLSKTLERLFLTKLLSECNDLNVFSNTQHGFMSKRSCTTNLLETYNYITHLVDGGVPCDLIFLDFSKAFDRVSHTILINKLHSLGFSQTTITWIHSYLYNRRQRVAIRGSFSPWSIITSGVPQGSVLGPVLFNIFVSDLSGTIAAQSNSYADDIKLFSPAITSTLQPDLHKISQWANCNSLPLNPSKCLVMHFGLHNPHHTYYIDGSPIKVTTLHSDLGILVDPSLKFHQHVEHVISKVYKKAHYILKKFTKTDCDTFSKLYKIFLRPVFEYCSQIARPCYSSYLDKLERCQRKLTKWCRAIRKLPYSLRLSKLGLPTVRDRFQRGDAILTYQIVHQKLDLESVHFFLPFDGPTRGHAFRLRGVTCRLNIRHRFFTERAINIWNSLPNDVVTATSTTNFKIRYDHHLASAAV
jgi:hypothetical protein